MPGYISNGYAVSFRLLAPFSVAQFVNTSVGSSVITALGQLFGVSLSRIVIHSADIHSQFRRELFSIIVPVEVSGYQSAAAATAAAQLINTPSSLVNAGGILASLSLMSPAVVTLFVLPCSPGQFSGSLGNAQCINCSAGSYSSVQSSSTCLPCPPGSHQSGAGKTACSACPAGTYQARAGTVANCTLCLAGTYQSGSGMVSVTNCTVCPAGMYTSAPGSMTFANCSSTSPSDSGVLLPVLATFLVLSTLFAAIAAYQTHKVMQRDTLARRASKARAADLEARIHGHTEPAAEEESSITAAQVAQEAHSPPDNMIGPSGALTSRRQGNLMDDPDLPQICQALVAQTMERSVAAGYSLTAVRSSGSAVPESTIQDTEDSTSPEGSEVMTQSQQPESTLHNRSVPVAHSVHPTVIARFLAPVSAPGVSRLPNTVSENENISNIDTAQSKPGQSPVTVSADLVMLQHPLQPLPTQSGASQMQVKTQARSSSGAENSGSSNGRTSRLISGAPFFQPQRATEPAADDTSCEGLAAQPSSKQESIDAVLNQVRSGHATGSIKLGMGSMDAESKSDVPTDAQCQAVPPLAGTKEESVVGPANTAAGVEKQSTFYSGPSKNMKAAEVEVSTIPKGTATGQGPALVQSKPFVLGVLPSVQRWPADPASQNATKDSSRPMLAGSAGQPKSIVGMPSVASGEDLAEAAASAMSASRNLAVEYVGGGTTGIARPLGARPRSKVRAAVPASGGHTETDPELSSKLMA